MFYYSAFGLSVRADLPFVELAEAIASTEVDLEIVSGSVEVSPSNKTRYSFEINGLGRFAIEDGRRITYEYLSGSDQSDLRLFILGSCFGCILQQRGFIVLHGNAIAIDDQSCRIVVGHRGAGKSTTAAWYFLQGNRILADDVCAIKFDEAGEAMVIPSYPQIKLWQASADLLGIATQGMRRIRPEFEKFGMLLGEQFVGRPLRLTEVVELDKDATVDKPVQGTEKLRLLVEHSYRYGYIRKMGLQQSYHQKLLTLAPKAKMFRSPRVNLAKVPTTV